MNLMIWAENWKSQFQEILPISRCNDWHVWWPDFPYFPLSKYKFACRLAWHASGVACDWPTPRVVAVIKFDQLNNKQRNNSSMEKYTDYVFGLRFKEFPTICLWLHSDELTNSFKEMQYIVVVKIFPVQKVILILGIWGPNDFFI